MERQLTSGTGEGYQARVDSRGCVYTRAFPSSDGTAVYTTQAAPPPGTSTLVAARTGRGGLQIANTGAGALTVRLGTGAGAGDFPLAPGGTFQLPASAAYAGAVTVFNPGAGAGAAVAIEYVTESVT